MAEIAQHAPGTFCWIELGTTEHASAKKFYSDLFGWITDDVPAGPGMVYTLLRLSGKDVGALYELTEEHRTQGVPPHWLSYLAVENADEAAKRVTAAGGTVVMPPFDVMDLGRMAMVQDPTGTTFAVWQARGHIGLRVAGEPGALCWNELATHDTSAAQRFYTAVFGWEPREQQFGSRKYTVFLNQNQQAGGMHAMPAEMASVPPYWMPYFAVTDCDATADRAKILGATVVAPPTDIPGVGRLAAVRDPQGAVFSVIKLAARPSLSS